MCRRKILLFIYRIRLIFKNKCLIEASIEGGKTKRVFGRQKNHVEELSASAPIKEESRKVSEDEESEKDNENNDEDHQVPAEDQADYHSNVVSLLQRPTVLSYYTSTTWYVRNHVFIDFIWACVISIYYFKFDNKSIGMTLHRNTEIFNFTFYILLL